ncbi:putative para-nitrobenzyl esterase protein [Ilyonectria robusta]
MAISGLKIRNWKDRVICPNYMTRQLIGSIPLHSRVQLLVGEDERVWEYIDDCPVELRSLCGIRGQNEGQAAILGGSTFVQSPASLDTAEAIYNKVTDSLKQADLSPNDRINALVTANEDEILGQADFTLGLNVVADGQVVPDAVSFDGLLKDSDTIFPGKQWCERLLIVQGNFESSIMGFLVLAPKKNGIAKVFCDSMTQTFESNPAIEQLLHLYELSVDTDDDAALVFITAYLNDLFFYTPACLLATLWPKGYVGNFNEGNPWDGPNRGKSNHMLDTALLWQQYNDRLSPSQVGVAEAYATDLAAFVAGLNKFPLFKESNQLVVWGPSDGGVTRQVASRSEAASGRRSEFFGIMEALGGLPALFAAHRAFCDNLYSASRSQS